MLNHKKQLLNFKIHFGSFGGFTGETDEYILYGNGTLCKVKAVSKDTVIIKQIENKDLKIIFELADSKKLRNFSLELVGNMNYFVKFYKNKVPVNTCQWTDGSKVPEDMKHLYNLLNNLIGPEK